MARKHLAALVCAIVCYSGLQLVAAQNRDLLQRTLPTAPPIPSLPGAPPAKAPAPSANTSSSNSTAADSLISAGNTTTTTTTSDSTSSVPKGPLEPLPASADVIIIGAGIAGLAAARTLHDLGYTTIILEASPRLGKPHRCITCAP